MWCNQPVALTFVLAHFFLYSSTIQMTTTKAMMTSKKSDMGTPKTGTRFSGVEVWTSAMVAKYAGTGGATSVARSVRQFDSKGNKREING